MAEPKKTLLERDVEATSKTLKKVTEKLNVLLPKQQVGFESIAESIKEANKLTKKSGKDFSDAGKEFNSQLDDIVKTSKSASRDDLIVQRKRLNEILGTIKDTVTDESERQAILDNFDSVKKQIQTNISFQSQVFEQLEKGISRQVTDGIAIISSIASDSPLVGFVFNNIIAATGSLFNTIREKRKRDKEIAIADLKQIKDRSKQTLAEKKKLLKDEQEKKEEKKEEKEERKRRKESDEKRTRIRTTNKVILSEIKLETINTNSLLENISSMFGMQQKREERVLSTTRARASEEKLESSTEEVSSPATSSIIQQKIAGGGDGILGFFGISLAGLMTGIMSVMGGIGALLISGPVLVALAGLATAGIATLFKDEILGFGKGVKEFINETFGVNLTFIDDLLEGFEKFADGITNFFQGNFLKGIGQVLESVFTTAGNTMIRAISRMLGKIAGTLGLDNSFIMDIIEKGKKFSIGDSIKNLFGITPDNISSKTTNPKTPTPVSANQEKSINKLIDDLANLSAKRDTEIQSLVGRTQGQLANIIDSKTINTNNISNSSTITSSPINTSNNETDVLKN